MAIETASTRIIKIHKKWADGLTIIWQLFVLILFGGIYLFLDHLDVDLQDRNSMLILLAVVVLVAAIWQAIGLGVARVHMILDGVDLERKKDESASR